VAAPWKASRGRKADALRELRQVHHAVREQHADGSVRRVGLPPAPEAAGPAHGAGVAAAEGGGCARRIDDHRHAKAEAVAGAEERHAEHRRGAALPGTQVVAAHQRDGVGREDALAVHGAALDEQAREGEVVVHRGPRTTAA
jgi:hypothetical protein